VKRTIHGRFRITLGHGCRLRGHFPACHRHDGFPSFQWWRAGRDRGTEQEPLSVLPFGHAMQVSTPRVHCCTFLSIGRTICSSLSSRTEPLARRSRNFHGQYHLGRPRHSLSGGEGGTPDLRRFRNNRRVSVPITCFHVASVLIERGIRVPDSVASRVFGQQGSVHSCRRHLL